MAPAKENLMAELMTEDNTAEKVAFVNRKYTNEEKLKREEEELEQLLAQQKGEQGDANQEQEEQQPENAEEKTFKKRYGDLRRHSQQKEDEYKKEIENLKRQLDSATKKEIKLPRTDEDIENWAAQYPDVAAIVETIAIKKAKEQAAALEDRIRAVDEMQYTAVKEKAEAELLRLHPDFESIRDDDDFHEWAEDQPKWVQDALYENDNDARSAARAIDLYKADRGITTKKKSTSKDAAKSVDTKGSRSRPTSDESSNFLRESQVQNMSAQEYEKRSDEIMDAIRSGKFIYDVSGSAR